MVVDENDQNSENDNRTERIDAGAASDLTRGSIRCVVLGGRRIALYCTASGVYASDDGCPHRGGPLSEGALMGDEVVCPWHLWSFDLRTGLTETVPDLSMQLHQVEIEDGRVFVRISPRPPSQTENP